MCIISLLTFFLRNYIETPNGMEHGIAGLGVDPSLGASLCVDHVLHIANLSEDVNAVQLEGEAAFQEGFGERTVPYDMGGIERTVAVAPAAIERGIGTELPVFGKVEQEVGSGCDVKGGDVFK